MNTRQKKIALVINPMEPGGAQTAGLKLEKELRRRGHSVLIIFMTRKRDFDCGDANVEVLLDNRSRSLLNIIRLFRRLCKTLKKGKFDTVITLTHYAAVFGSIAAFASRIPVRIASHRNDRAALPASTKVIIPFLSLSGIITGHSFVSEEVRRGLSFFDPFGGKSYVIVNGTDVKPAALSREEARKKLNLPQGVPLLVNTARLSPQKNQALLIKAVSRVENLHLAIAGKGELEYNLIELAEKYGIKDRLHLIGNIPHSRINVFYRAGDLFAFPSKYEGCPNALLEAAGTGLAAVCSDIPAHRGLFTEEEVCFASADNVDSWTEAVEKLLINKEERDNLGKNALRKSKQYSVERMADKFLKLVG